MKDIIKYGALVVVVGCSTTATRNLIELTKPDWRCSYIKDVSSVSWDLIRKYVVDAGGNSYVKEGAFLGLNIHAKAYKCEDPKNIDEKVLIADANCKKQNSEACEMLPRLKKEKKESDMINALESKCMDEKQGKVCYELGNWLLTENQERFAYRYLKQACFLEFPKSCEKFDRLDKILMQQKIAVETTRQNDLAEQMVFIQRQESDRRAAEATSRALSNMFQSFSNSLPGGIPTTRCTSRKGPLGEVTTECR